MFPSTNSMVGDCLECLSSSTTSKWFVLNNYFAWFESGPCMSIKGGPCINMRKIGYGRALVKMYERLIFCTDNSLAITWLCSICWSFSTCFILACKLNLIRYVEVFCDLCCWLAICVDCWSLVLCQYLVCRLLTHCNLDALSPICVFFQQLHWCL